MIQESIIELNVKNTMPQGVDDEIRYRYINVEVTEKGSLSISKVVPATSITFVEPNDLVNLTASVLCENSSGCFVVNAKVGNNVSHSKRRTKRRRSINI
mgnify:CR=1 FL=1